MSVLPAASEVLVPDVVRDVAFADEHDLLEVGQVRTDLLDRLREERVGEDDLRARVLEDELELLGGQADVEAVDDAAAHEARLVQLDEGVAVEREDADAVVPLHAELGAERVGEPADALEVLLVRRLVLTVDHRDLRAVALDRRDQLTVIDELFDDAVAVSHVPSLVPTCANRNRAEAGPGRGRLSRRRWGVPVAHHPGSREAPMSRRSVRSLLVVGVLAGTLVVAQRGSPLRSIQPGAPIVAGNALCTLNWIYDGAGGPYAGTAGHCVESVGQRRRARRSRRRAGGVRVRRVHLSRARLLADPDRHGSSSATSAPRCAAIRRSREAFPRPPRPRSATSSSSPAAVSS